MSYGFSRILRILTDFLFPSFCSLCDVKLINSDEINYGLCDNCREIIIQTESENSNACKCKICGKPLISEHDTCLSCRKETEKSYNKLWVLYPYTGKYRELLAQYKFKKKLPLANFFTKQIMSILNELELKEATIVPVPPRPGKKKEQGWDQIDYFIKKIKKPVSRCLKRKKSQVQKELNREERLNNLKDRIFVTGKVPKIALIIDDVITTGATIEACASTLKQAGAEKVFGLCLFYD